MAGVLSSLGAPQSAACLGLSQSRPSTAELSTLETSLRPPEKAWPLPAFDIWDQRLPSSTTTSCPPPGGGGRWGVEIASCRKPLLDCLYPMGSLHLGGPHPADASNKELFSYPSVIWVHVTDASELRKRGLEEGGDEA